MTADAIDRHLKPAHRLIPSKLDIVLQPVKLPRSIREREFFCERDVSDWEKQYDLNFSPLLETCPPMTMDQIRPQEMNDWEFVSEPRVVASIDLTERSHASFDEQFEFQLGEKTADGMVVFFETVLSEKQHLSTTPSEVSSTNHWLSPCHMFHSEFRDRISIGYRFGVPNEADGAYLSNWPGPV